MSEKIDRFKKLNIIRVRNYRQKIKQQSTRDATSDSEIDYDVESLQNVQDCEDLKQSIEAGISSSEDFSSHLSESKESLFVDSESECSFSDYNSDSASSDDDFDMDSSAYESKVVQDLRKWAIQSKIAHSKLDSLLKVLKPHHPELPVSSKSLLKSNLGLQKLIKKFNPNDQSDTSEYVYFGIAWHLYRIVNINSHPDNTIRLQFNVDGLPIFRSSSREFWPLLGKIYSEDVMYKPFTICVHCGFGKPKSVDNYLHDFITELNQLLQNGITIKGQDFKIEVMCFICDRPARSFIKCIKGHTGYYACERCTIKGYYYKKRTVYLSTNTKRNDKSFRNLINIEHHHGVSPLTLINPPIDMIHGFVLDFMHLGYLGVMKKLLSEYWLSNAQSKLSRENILRMSQRLTNMSNQVPLEFQRTTRSLGEINKFKATEFRFFLLYAGPFVLKDILPTDLYKHFLLFHVASRILSSQDFYKDLTSYADIYLHRFVLLAQQLYGLESQVLNVHSLIHLADDVREMGCSLTHLTAFTFENALGKMKQSLRSGNKPLSQLCRRMEEDFVFDSAEILQIKKFEILKYKSKGNQKQIHRLKYNGCELTVREPNNAILLKTGDLIKINLISSSSLCSDPSQISIVGRKLKIIKPAYEYPTDSSTLKIFTIEEDIKCETTQFYLNQVHCKIIILKLFELPTDKKELFAIPLLHQF